MRQIITLIILWFSIFSAGAAGPIYIFHINGINASLEEAKNNARNLHEKAMLTSNLLANKGTFNLLYNKEDPQAFFSLYDQLMDVLVQKRTENFTLDDFTQAWLRAHPEYIYPVASREYEQLKQEIKHYYFTDPAFMGTNFQDLVQQLHEKAYMAKEFNHILTYLNTNSSGMEKTSPMILLVPHSQGNLYANRLFEYLTQYENFASQQIKILGIATAANHVAVHGSTDSYITSSNDKVINALRFLAEPDYQVLPANLELETSFFDLGHGLIDTYLAQAASVQKYRLYIQQQLTALIQFGIPKLDDSANNYGIWYRIEKADTDPELPKPQFLDPLGNDRLCTNAEECTQLGVPFLCGYSTASQNNFCQVYLNSLPGRYYALQPKHNNWQLSAGNIEKGTLSCYDNIHCSQEVAGQCIRYAVYIIQDDTACHMLAQSDDYFNYQSSLPLMFINDYYKAFWINNQQHRFDHFAAPLDSNAL